MTLYIVCYYFLDKVKFCLSKDKDIQQLITYLGDRFWQLRG